MKTAIKDIRMAELLKSENLSAFKPYSTFVTSISKALLKTAFVSLIVVDMVIQKATWMLTAESVSDVAS